jgi:hypothetical protein
MMMVESVDKENTLLSIQNESMVKQGQNESIGVLKKNDS